MLKKSILSILMISILIWCNSCKKTELENPTQADLFERAKNYVDAILLQQNANSFVKRMNFQIQWDKAITDSANNIRVPVSFNLLNLKPKDGKQVLNAKTKDVFELYIREDNGKIDASIMQFMSIRGTYYPLRYTLTGERKTKLMVEIPANLVDKTISNTGVLKDRLLLSLPNSTMIYESEFMDMVRNLYGSDIGAVVTSECQLGSYFNPTTCTCDMADEEPTNVLYPALFMTVITNSGYYERVPYPFSFHPFSIIPDPDYPDEPIGGGGDGGGGDADPGNTATFTDAQVSEAAVYDDGKPKIADITKYTDCFDDGKQAQSYTMTIYADQPVAGKSDWYKIVTPGVATNNPFGVPTGIVWTTPDGTFFDVGHTFVTFEKNNTDGTNVRQTLGFYPSGNPLVSKGAMENNSNHLADVSYTINVTQAQFNAALSKVESDFANKTYVLTNLNGDEYNCTDAALSWMNAAGANLQNSSMGLFKNTPGNLGQMLRAKSGANTSPGAGIQGKGECN